MANKSNKNNKKKKVKKQVDKDNLKIEKVNNINKKVSKEKINNKNNSLNITNDINDKIQSIVSILFTIVIFALILVLIFVLYNKFLKNENNYDKNKICSEYIKKDYNINKSDILEYIKDNRYIIYNIEEFNSKNIDKNTINNFSKYIIWNSEEEYSLCDNHEYCLDTKKEMDYNSLKEKLLYYFNLKSLNLVFDYNFNNDDTTRLYINNDKVILTFKNMLYETYKHDIVDLRIDENNIYIIFALSRKINDSNYVYTGYKNLILEYDNNKFIIKSIKTTIIQ